MSPPGQPSLPTPSGHVTVLTLGPTPKVALGMGALFRQDLLLAPEKAPADRATKIAQSSEQGFEFSNSLVAGMLTKTKQAETKLGMMEKLQDLQCVTVSI